MKIRYDSSVDAAYISLVDDDEAPVFGFTYACDSAEVNGGINLDFDVSGRLMGIEVLQASKTLFSSLLQNLEFAPLPR